MSRPNIDRIFAAWLTVPAPHYQILTGNPMTTADLTFVIEGGVRVAGNRSPYIVDFATTARTEYVNVRFGQDGLRDPVFGAP